MRLSTWFKKGYLPLPQSSNQPQNDTDLEEEDKEVEHAFFIHNDKKEHNLRAALCSVSFLLVACLVALLILSLRIQSLAAARDSCFADNFVRFRSPLGRDVRYMTRDHVSDFLWDPMLKDGLGEFATPGEEYETGEYSMFHQLRCLARFRVAIQRASEGNDVGVDFHEDHWGHCLDYMRRVILCNADNTIERPRLAQHHSDGRVHHAIEGVEEFRTCRSVKPMCRVLKERGLSNASCLAELDPSLGPWPTQVP